MWVLNTYKYVCKFLKTLPSRQEVHTEGMVSLLCKVNVIIVLSFTIVILRVRSVYHAYNILSLFPIFAFWWAPTIPLLCYSFRILHKKFCEEKYSITWENEPGSNLTNHIYEISFWPQSILSHLKLYSPDLIRDYTSVGNSRLSRGPPPRSRRLAMAQCTGGAWPC